MNSVVGLLTRDKARAHQRTFAAVMALPAIDATKKRPTPFHTIANSRNHVLIVDNIFALMLRENNTLIPISIDDDSRR